MQYLLSVAAAAFFAAVVPHSAAEGSPVPDDPLFQCECVYGYFNEIPQGSQSLWFFTPKSYLNDGLCDAATPPCEEFLGCYIDYVVAFLNKSGVPQTVTVTYPKGIKTKSIVLHGDPWSQRISADVRCGDSIIIEVSDGSEARLICSACEEQV